MLHNAFGEPFHFLVVLHLVRMDAHAASAADEISFFTVNGQQVNNVIGSFDFGSWSWNGNSKSLYLKDYNGSDINFIANEEADVPPTIDVYVSGDCVVNGNFIAPFYVPSDALSKGGYVRFYLSDGASLTINGELKCFDIEIHKKSASTGAKATFNVNGGVNCFYDIHHHDIVHNVKISGNIVATLGNGTNAYGINGGARWLDISDPVAVTVQGSTAALNY